jgi:hypothetical protein
VFAQRCEQQRPIVLNPKIAFLLHKIAQHFFAIFRWIRGLQMLGIEPLLISTAHRRMDDGALVLNAKEKVDSGLLVSICKKEKL